MFRPTLDYFSRFSYLTFLGIAGDDATKENPHRFETQYLFFSHFRPIPRRHKAARKCHSVSLSLARECISSTCSRSPPVYSRLSFFDCRVTFLSPARFSRGLSVLSGPCIFYYRKKTSYSPSRTIADENAFVPVARVPRD